MSTLVSPHVLRGAHVPAPWLPRLPHLRVVGPTEHRSRPGPVALVRPLRPVRPVRPVAPAWARQRQPVAAPHATPLRLTRRGRRVIGLALAAGVAVPALAGHLTTSAGTPVTGAATSTIEQVDVSRGAAPWSTGSVEAERVAAGLSSPPAGWAVVTVLPGESLWVIAGRRAAGGDPRDVLRRIVARNGLVGTEITAGDALLVPST